jgi:Cdc6-like AAA superfamily ATPase
MPEGYWIFAGSFFLIVPYLSLIFFLSYRRAVELVQATQGTVKAPHIREVVQLMQNSPTAAFLRDLSFHERLVLASLVSCAKREGVEEIKWSDVHISLPLAITTNLA